MAARKTKYTKAKSIVELDQYLRFDDCQSVLAKLMADLKGRIGRVRYQAATKGSLSEFEFAPGQVTLLGGQPGVGKTALGMQIVVDALRLNSGLKAIVANVEMPPDVLLERQLSRISGVGLNTIRFREYTSAQASRLAQGSATLANIQKRLSFLRPPFDIPMVEEAMFSPRGGTLVLIDYVQRIAPVKDGIPEAVVDQRQSINLAMSQIRDLADFGIAVILISAVGRSRDNHGQSGYTNSTLASFRETSELEYGADDAYILDRLGGGDSDSAVILRHLKSRYGEQRDIELDFDKKHQRFMDPGYLNKGDDE